MFTHYHISVFSVVRSIAMTAVARLLPPYLRSQLWLPLLLWCGLGVLASSCGNKDADELSGEQQQEPAPAPEPEEEYIPPPVEEEDPEPIAEEPAVIHSPVQQAGKAGALGGVIQGVAQGKGGIAQGKGGIIQGVGQGKGGIAQGKGGIIQGVGQGKGGIAQGKGGIVQGVGQGKGGIAQGKGGIIQGVGQGKGGIGQGKGGIVQGVGQGKSGIAQGKALDSAYHATHGIGPYSSTEAFQAFSNAEQLIAPASSACSSAANHHITYKGQSYTLERYVTSLYANQVMSSSGFISIDEFATILAGQFFDVPSATLGSVVVHQGQIYHAGEPLSYTSNGLLMSPAAHTPVATIALGEYAFSKDQSDVGRRSVELNFGILGSCLGVYKDSQGQYLGDKQLVLVLP